MPSTHTVQNIGNGGSPLANLMAHSMDLRSSAPVREFDSLRRQNARALDVGAQGDVNAYKRLGLMVG